MQVFEEIGRNKTEFRAEDWHIAYNYIKNTINKRFDFDEIEEDIFIFNEEGSTAHFEINLFKYFDQYTFIEIGFETDINTETNDIAIEQEGVLKTTYPENTPFQKSLFYYFLRTVWEKLYYGKVRQQYKTQCKQLLQQIRDAIIEAAQA